MALITCPECGQNISNMADKCPHCGLPQSHFNSQATIAQPNPQPAPQPQMGAQLCYPYQQPQQPQMNAFGNYNGGRMAQPVKPDSYMALAIISLIIGGLLFGIISLVYSSKVDSLYANGNYTEAISASNSAKIWAIVGIALGVISAIATTFYVVEFVY